MSSGAINTTQNVTIPHITELYDTDYLNALLPAQRTPVEDVSDVSSTTAAPSNPMMDALASTANQAYTENLAMAYESTDSPLLDAFHRIGPYSDGSLISKALGAAWKESPDMTLRIIWYIRSIHEGKGERKPFYAAFGWLYKNHPRTAISNLGMLVSQVCPNPKNKHLETPLPDQPHGYFKDLLNILMLATVDQLGTTECSILNSPPPQFTKDGKMVFRGPRPVRSVVFAQRHEQLVAKLSDPTFRALFVTVARIFAQHLGNDIKVLLDLDGVSPDDSQRRKALYLQLSLAGKWAPTPGGSHDRVTNISTAVALLLHHGRQARPGPSALGSFGHDGALDAERATILRSYFQRWFLTPLRQTLLLPEPLMSAGKWGDIRYNRVASECMRINTEHFFAHDPDRFQDFLVKVESGKSKISGAILFPHALLQQIVKVGNIDLDDSQYPKVQEFRRNLKETQMRALEAQWKTMVDHIRQSGSLDNSMAVCDVSGSMGDLWYTGGRDKHVEPIFPAVALSLVLSTLTKPPFNAGFITFSSKPEFVQLDLSKPVFDIVNEMVSTAWEMNTDLNAVFTKLLLPVAVRNQVKQEDMIKRVFVFSDMQFDAAASEADGWKTNYDVIVEAYKAAGYEVPEIVFWDLGGYDTVETNAEREGVAMMKGFSTAMMKVFLGEEAEEQEAEGDWDMVDEKEDGEEKKKDAFNPLNIMKKALLRKSFDGLQVVD